MYWNEREDTPSSSGSSAASSTPATLFSDLPPSPITNSWPTGPSKVTKEVLQSVLKVRKTWKTFRGGETVWPLELEAALIEGLEKYEPDDSRETRMLGRFPRRNRFISDYIFGKTGKRRSPKQVGSRLQQLRESCGGEQLLQLLSPFRRPGYSASNASADSALSSSIITRTSSGHTVIYIDILPQGSPDQTRCRNCSSPWSDTGDVIHAADYPRRLQDINPTVSFTSAMPTIAHSRFTVYSEDLILHAETVPLVLQMDRIPQSSGFLYSTRLIPKYWQTILDSPDPIQFTIFQEVLKEDDLSVLFSATYKFSYPRSSTIGSSSHRPHFASENTHPDVPYTSISAYSSVPDTQYPYNTSPAVWSTPLPRDTTTTHRYPSPGSDTSSHCFSADLLQYTLTEPDVPRFHSRRPAACFD
ncbi:hypothetical protein DFH06DRAFT_1213233 [Mycena polygramma]|nr:hypothetical protein DFH06DRAFT_1213233 [Mycena polygramma]